MAGKGEAFAVQDADLDSLYAAMEQASLRIAIEQPVAVQWWDGVTAVYSAARAADIVRHERVRVSNSLQGSEAEVGLHNSGRSVVDSTSNANDFCFGDCLGSVAWIAAQRDLKVELVRKQF